VNDHGASPLTIDDLLARAEIGDALNRYVRGADRADADLMRSAFHDDGYDDHGNYQGPSYEFADWVCGERSKRYQITMHFLAPPNIRREGDEAYVDTYCLAHHLSQPDERGAQTNKVIGLRYLDRFERRNSAWLIAHRAVVYDWSHVIPVEPGVAPRYQEGLVPGTRDRTDRWYEMSGAAGAWPPVRT
jgi:SnoaL-like protein